MTIALGAAGCSTLSAQPTEPEYAVKVEKEQPQQIDWVPAIRALKPLSQPRGERWPMICWENAPFTPLSADIVKDELARGFVPHIRLDEKMIGVAQSIQAAGGPVIMMEGGGGSFPYSKAGAPAEWAHELPADFKDKTARACVGIFKGWQVEADEIRRVLRAYKAAGVTVNAAWLDWEGEPLYIDEAGYAQALACPRCRATLPEWALQSWDHYKHYTRKLSSDLFGAYLAAPFAEIFPGCATTNWIMTASTAQNPMRSWYSKKGVPVTPSLMTMTNPVAYGNSVFYDVEWDKGNPPTPAEREKGRHSPKRATREEVDQLYMNLLLRGVSINQQNIEEVAPWMRSAPWVARWCPDDEDLTIPLMSRERYREALRHIWLRGAVTMQVFNANRPGFAKIVVTEIEDTHSVYDESLAWNDFILHGTCMNLAYPQIKDDGVIWSGMRLKDSAVVRTFKQGGGEASVTITPFPDHPNATVKLDADTKGATYFLRLDGEKVKVISGE
jgi:hypothetical protein